MTYIDGGTLAKATAPWGEKLYLGVAVAPFCLDTREVTARAYRACSSCGAAPATVETHAAEWWKKQWSSLCNGNRDDRLDHPMNCVDWTQAKTYCRAQGKRLPTEEEWEWAARGPRGRRFPWGDAAPSANSLNACGTECRKLRLEAADGGIVNAGDREVLYEEDDGWGATAPVGSFPAGATPEGLLDMAGNVWEWTDSHYTCRGEACVDPRIAIRGGGWGGSAASMVHSGARDGTSPAHRAVAIGFRCARAR